MDKPPIPKWRCFMGCGKEFVLTDTHQNNHMCPECVAKEKQKKPSD